MEKIQAYRQIKKNLIVKKIMISVLSFSGATLSHSKLSDFILELRIEFYQTFCIRTLNFN